MSETSCSVRSRPERFEQGSSQAGTVLLSLCICALTLCVFLLYSERCLHWFVVPVFLCGVLIGVDAITWLRGRLDLYDPVGVLGILGFHLFFLVPLLHVAWDQWSHPKGPEDWREWLGLMAILNGIGLALYCIFREVVSQRSNGGRSRTVWTVSATKFLLILAAALLVTSCVQALVFARYGGLLGYMRAFSAKERTITGMGWIFMISESFPILTVIGYAVYVRRSGRRPALTTICLVLLAFFVLQLLFGGLRGSRSNTIWALFWATGIIHLTVRPIPRKLVALGLLFLFVFMYLYGFYKSYGLDAVEAFQESQAGDETAAPQHRTLRSVVVGDLGRAEVQAFLLYRLVSPGQATDYQYGCGRTYLGAASLVIPKSLWPDRPVGKRKEGTELEYGFGSYRGGRTKSTRVYGLAGEAMLNFGPLGVPFAFVAFGVVVGWVRRCLMTWHPADCRLLLAPYLVNMCFVMLVGDSDNLVFFIITNGAIPALVIGLSLNWQCIGKSKGLPNTVGDSSGQRSAAA